MNQTEKVIRQAAEYARKAGKDITEADIKEKYEEYAQRYGQERADIALKNTLANFKERARLEETRLFSRLRAECLDKYGFAPANRRTFLAEIRENHSMYDTPAAQEYRRRFMK